MTACAAIDVQEFLPLFEHVDSILIGVMQNPKADYVALIVEGLSYMDRFLEPARKPRYEFASYYVVAGEEMFSPTLVSRLERARERGLKRVLILGESGDFDHVGLSLASAFDDLIVIFPTTSPLEGLVG